MELVVTKDNVVDGIFYQDREMKCMFDKFPELLFIDATYKLNNLRMPLYVYLVEDGNGESEIVALFMVTSENADSIKKMAMIFKKHNSNWKKTSTIIISDKERDVFKSEFPQASILICLFHVLRTFRREITSEKLGITAAERSLVLELVQRMAYAKLLDEYMELYKELHELKLTSVNDYFDLNWHTIKEQWVECLKSDNITFLNRTNNRLECINQKLKSVITKYSNLPQFFSQLLITLDSLRTERDHRALTIFHKVPVTPFAKGTPESKYMELLTPYALNYVIKQLQLISKVRLSANEEECEYDIHTSEGILHVLSHSCECGFWKAMQLPCRHILAVRSDLKLDLYSPDLCAMRWTLNYYHTNHRILTTNHYDYGDNSFNVSEMTSCRPSPILSQQEKYRKAFRVAQKLASLVSEAPMREFDQKLETLKTVMHTWEQGTEVTVQGILSTNSGQ